MLKDFVVGSSIISTIISFSYIGNAFRRSGRPSDVPYELIPIFISIMFGLFNVLNVYLRNEYDLGNIITFIVGGTMGVLFSIAGRFGYDLPVRMFNFNRGNEYMVHLIAFLLYGSIFTFVVQPLNEII